MLIAGLQLSVRETGEGLPMVFQHGLCGDAAQPADVFPFDDGFRCLTLECRGHGQSEPGPLEDFSIATFASDVAAFIEAQNAGPVVLGGISMGAAISLRLAVLRPDLVRALVLARPAWTTDAAPPNLRPNALVGELLARYPADDALAQFDASDIAQLLAKDAPDNLATLRGFFSRQPLAVTSALLSRIANDGPGVSWPQIAAIQVPTLVIGHGRDYIHPIAMARDLAAAIPGAALAEITPKADDKELFRTEFKAALAAFFKELSA
jgi:pimeloyl-ACP methyl ester carboxylesterase